MEKLPIQKITTFLSFQNQAEEAVRYYTSIFKNSKVLRTLRWGDVGPGPKGGVLTIAFELEGQQFVAMNGGPHFTFTDGISLSVDCKSQAEVDELWEKLSAGGEKRDCGWVRDRFGVSWQVVPTVMLEMLNDPDPARAGRAMAAMMTMQKLDIAKLTRAYEGG